ncbi:hypothetical protein QYM36_018370 [Artemia franciscana]|uniref:VLIG-type G domain-containing protein n=1 Tax=Artemia franciscana TaxID=6661 RepID=A0AA88HD38_ARTSF|nr:hypothetical protein QYM36_018370 [Artemia franciscana]
MDENDTTESNDVGKILELHRPSFILDCPPAVASAPYRLLHRLDLNFCDSSDGEEEDFFSQVEETSSSTNVDISKLLGIYSPKDNINIIRLLLESRYAIPICNTEIIQLLRITQRLEDDEFLAEDLKLPRIAIISQVKKFQSSAGRIMEEIFNLKTSFKTVETSGIEIGQGLICLENKKKESKKVIVINIQGNFEQYWKILTDFADYLVVEDEYDSEPDADDYIFVGNEFLSQSGRPSPFIRKFSNEVSVPKFITVWIPSFSKVQKISDYRPFCLIEGSLDYFINMQRRRQLIEICREAALHQTPLHSYFSSDGQIREKMDILQKVYLDVSKMNGIEEYLPKFLLLQKSFTKEGIQRNNIDETVLYFHVLDNAIANNIQNSEIMAQLLQELQEKTSKFSEGLQLSVMDSKRGEQVELSRKELTVAKKKWNNAALSLRHLWREISLLYSSGNREEFEDLPKRAAFYLIAGETLELYDGDANMLNVEWISAIFKDLESLLPKKRVFVLSVLGVQSNGKSTLLNTMFGIRLPTSIGQCTRGLTMTLVKTVERQEYDYVMIFDTEGLRSPKDKGFPGSVKRDNKIATLSILPSNATILVINGEDDNTLKDILPVVTLAYKGSRLAGEREGILSCKIFAAYSQVKTDGKNLNKLQNIFTQLSTTLVESFAKTNSFKDLEGHTTLKFSKMLTSMQDIQVFGCNSKGNPPFDVPNVDFSQQLVEFREHIHKQVVSQSGWNAREFSSLENYLHLVWDCLKNSNFDLSFETVIERHAYTELENKYQNLRNTYYDEYEHQFNLLKDKYKEDSSLAEKKPLNLQEIHVIVEGLELKMKPQSDKFEEETNLMFEGKQNQKWKIEFSKKVRNTISLTTSQWRHKLDVVLRNQLMFGVKVKEYQKEMRDNISKEFRAQSMKTKTEAEIINLFCSIFNGIVEKAKKENSPLNVKDEVLTAYRSNSTIVSLGIDLLCENDKTSSWEKIWDGTRNKATSLIDATVDWFKHGRTNENPIEKMVVPIVIRVANGKKYYCDAVVHTVIQDIETFIGRRDEKINKAERKRIHRVAYDLLVDIFTDIQEKWEQKNSIYVRFRSMKMPMQHYCLNVVKGLKDLDLMASSLEEVFSKHLAKAFESEVNEIVITNLRKKRWPRSPKYVHNHMDLYLIEEVEPKGINEILKLIKQNSVELKKLTTSRLVSWEVDFVLGHFTWENFKVPSSISLRNAYHSVSEDDETKSFHFCNLFKSFRNFKSTYFAHELEREMDALFWTGLEQMSKEFELRHIDFIVNKLNATATSVNKNSIVNSVLVQLKDSPLFDAGFCTSCEKNCPLCKSFCFLELFHDGRHDTFHQPMGLTGWRFRGIDMLTDYECNNSPVDQHYFYHGTEKRFADFSKDFSTWHQPDRTLLVSEYRQYLIRKYNKEIAIYYKVNPSDSLGPPEKLDFVKSKIKRKIDFHQDFPSKN